MITKEMTVLAVIERYPETRAVFDAYGAESGNCLCCSALFETLAAVAAQYELPLDRLLADLNRAAGLRVGAG